MYKKERTEKLKRNIQYLIKSRGETRVSLCNASGLTRTTIYNILEGRVVNVQESTIRKISDFFGVFYKEMETVDIEEREIVESSSSLHGNMNPVAVPVIRESLLLQNMDKRIGELAVTFPLTYYFGVACNLIGVRLENNIGGEHDAGDVLIIKRGLSNDGCEKLVWNRLTKKLLIAKGDIVEFEGSFILGDMIEERFNGEE